MPRQKIPVQRSLVSWFLLATSMWSGRLGAAEVVAPPALYLEQQPESKVLLYWANTAEGFVLEQAELLSPPIRWQSVLPAPSVDNDRYSIRLDATAPRRFYRLQLPPPTRVQESSPLDGETGVAVLRETILHFSNPLAPDTVLTTGQFYASFGGRRLLSRVEISSDRRTATLFYLEPLPGSARVVVVFEGDGLRDVFGRLIDADGDGQPGGAGRITFDTLTLTPLAGTAVIGRVFASELVPGLGVVQSLNRPLEGVTITVDGMEETLRTVTDAMGNFKLEPAPPGRFFVKIDGRTAVGSDYPNGAYYPYVGKAWEAIAGRGDNLAGGTGEVYLPRIGVGALRPVSPVEETVVSFPSDVIGRNPELEGVSIFVPANALLSENGVRGGRVGLAPVSPDRLPEPLPPGLNFPLVITIQTDGAGNFDRPVPVRFPNLPDPITGRTLPPGAKSALWSFNHDTGRFEVVGPMTVSADGRFVETDPGVGVLAPGWHGSFPGVRGKGGKIRPPAGGNCPPETQLATPCSTLGSTPLDFSEWTETSVAADGNTTEYKGFAYGGAVCFEAASGCWRFNVTSMKSKGNINLTLSGSMEPNPTTGGNVTASNYCGIIEVLAGYLGRGRATGPDGWHTLDASRAHEYHHRDADWKAIMEPLWETAEALMESECIPCGKTMSEAEVALKRKLDDILNQFSQDFVDGVTAYNATHDTAKNDEAYQAGQKKLDEMIEKIRAFAASQSYPGCPSNASASSVSLTRQFAGVPKRLVRLTASISSDLLQAGRTAQITVRGVYSDGSTADLTAGATGTRYFVSDPAIASVNSDGLVTALAPGGTFVTVSHSPGIDMIPWLAVATFTVQSPDDPDNDGLPTVWERLFGLAPNDPTDAKRDADGDGLTNADEYLLDTSPVRRDSDADSVDDDDEVIDGSDPGGPNVPDRTPQTGLHYFALVNRDTGKVVQRGIAGSNGEAHSNLILQPNTSYRHFILQAKTLRVGSSDFTTPGSGATLTLPAVILHEPDAADADGDGLPDAAEFILGTGARQVDSDGDALPDGAEVLQGTNPLDDRAIRTGVVATARTAGPAMDICAVNDLALVAMGQTGVSVFNVFSGLNPTLIAQVDTPGDAVAISCSGSLGAVADGPAGLAILQLDVASGPRIVHQVNLGGTSRAVAAAGAIAYVGTSNAQLIVVDMETGTVLDRVPVSGMVHDLAIEGDTLFVLLEGELLSYSVARGFLEFTGSAATAGYRAESFTGRKRLFVGGGVAYAASYLGYETFDVRTPSSMPRLGAIKTGGPNSFKQIVSNGSGLGVAAVGVNSRDDDTHDVWLYDVSNPAATDRFLTALATPGLTRAVSIYSGLAYVADGEAGIQVINYLEYDRLGRAPTIRMASNFAPGRAEEGKQMRLTASVSDDVQVRNVEFHVDGKKMFVDGNFPFEYRFVTPLLSQSPSLRVRAKATDTGGNAAWSEEAVFSLVSDATPPRVVRTSPASGGVLEPGAAIIAYWSEPVEAGTLDTASFQLFHLGPDGLPGTADDTLVPGGSVSYRPEISAAVLVFDAALPPGGYRAVLSASVADLVANRLAGNFEWTFVAAGQLQFGETAQASLDTTGEADLYLFQAQAGDVVRARMVRAEALDPQLEIRDSEGRTVAQTSTYAADSLLDVKLAVAGEYSIVASDRDADETGPYSIGLQRLNGPVGVEVVVFGEVFAGVIDAGARMNAYRFEATLGDVVQVRMSRAGGVDPQIELFDASGKLLGEASSYGAEAALDLAVETTGAFFILLRDRDGDESGAYGATVQRLNNPAATRDVEYGRTVSGSLDAVAEMDGYRFLGTAGEVVRVRLSRGEEIDPQIALFDLRGRRLSLVSTYGSDVVLDTRLETSGAFLVQVSDRDGDETGSYGLSPQRLNDPAGGKAIVFGGTYDGAFDAGAEMDTYSFQPVAGDVIQIRMSRVTAVDPQLELFDAQGRLLEESSSYSTEATLELALRATGLVFLVLRDRDGDESGPYALSLQRLNNPAGAVPINFGQTVSGSLDALAKIDAYRFQGNAGETVRIRMSRVSAVDPRIEAFDNAGNRLGVASSHSSETELTVKLESTGAFSILASDWDGDELGTYKIEIERITP